MATVDVIYKSIKTTKALEYMQEVMESQGTKSIELLGFAVSNNIGELDANRTLESLNLSSIWFPVNSTTTPPYQIFTEAPKSITSSGAQLTFTMNIPAGLPVSDCYFNETYIFARFNAGAGTEGEIFLFAIGQSFENTSKLNQYIPNTSYTQVATFELFNGSNSKFNLIVNQASMLLVAPPITLEPQTAEVGLCIDDTLILRNTPEGTGVGVTGLTNFIAKKSGSASYNGMNLTIPDMTLYVPDGRDDDDKLLSSIIETSGATFALNPNLEDNTYWLFYNTNKNDIHLTPYYSKHINTEPSSGVYDEVIYLNSNVMKTTEDIAPNYVLTGDVSVSEDGIVSNLGTLSGSIEGLFSSNPVFNLDFTTGSDVTTTQSLFSLPYAYGSIANNRLSVDLSSYAYEVEYHKEIKSGNCIAQPVETIRTCILGSNTYYAQEELSSGITLYTDYNYTEPYGIAVFNDDNVIVSSENTVIDNKVYTKASTATELWTISLSHVLSSTDTSTTTAFSGQSITGTSSMIYDSAVLSNPVGTILDVDTENNTISLLVYNNATYTLTSENVDNYSYTIDTDTIYTSVPLAVGVQCFEDSGFSTYVGEVTAIDTTNATVSVQFDGTYTETQTYASYAYYAIEGNTYFTTAQNLEENVELYNSYTMSTESLVGIVSVTSSTNVTVIQYDTLYDGAYTSSSFDIHPYTFASDNTTVYCANEATAGETVYLDKLLSNPYAIVSTVSVSTMYLQSFQGYIGYVREQGSGVVAINIQIFDTPAFTGNVTISSGYNANYTGNSLESALGTLSIEVASNTAYKGTLSFNGSTYSLVLNDITPSIINTTRLPYMGASSFLILGGVENFSGTFNIQYQKSDDNEWMSGTGMEDVWTWNGFNETEPGWNIEPLCELGNLTILNGEIVSLTFNDTEEIVKFADLNYTGSSRINEDWGRYVFSSVPLVYNKKVALANGQQLSIKGTYSNFVKFMASLAEEYMGTVFCAETEWQAIKAQYGACTKYVYDATTGQLRIPYALGIPSGVLQKESLNIIPESFPSLEHSHALDIASSNIDHTHGAGKYLIQGSGILLSTGISGLWNAGTLDYGNNTKNYTAYDGFMPSTNNAIRILTTPYGGTNAFDIKYPNRSAKSETKYLVNNGKVVVSKDPLVTRDVSNKGWNWYPDVDDGATGGNGGLGGIYANASNGFSGQSALMSSNSTHNHPGSSIATTNPLSIQSGNHIQPQALGMLVYIVVG